MTTPEFHTRPTRLSDAERDHAIEVLRENSVEGRLSHETFLRRMELAFRARGRAELDDLTADLPSRGRLSRRLVGMVARLSALNVRLRGAWHAERLPRLRLPEPRPYPLRIGRAPGCDLRLGDESVSRVHAELRLEGESWVLRDLGSTNGTCINGWRVVGAVGVRPGDQVSFGKATFRLAAR